MSLYNIIYIYVCTCLYCSWTLARSPHVSLKFSFIQHWISWTYFGRTAFHILSFIWLKAHSDSCFFVDCVYVYSLYVYIYTYDTYPSLFVIRFLCKSHFMFFLQAAFEEAHLGKMERFDAGSRHQHQLQSSTEIET